VPAQVEPWSSPSGPRFSFLASGEWLEAHRFSDPVRRSRYEHNTTAVKAHQQRSARLSIVVTLVERREQDRYPGENEGPEQEAPDVMMRSSGCRLHGFSGCPSKSAYRRREVFTVECRPDKRGPHAGCAGARSVSWEETLAQVLDDEVVSFVGRVTLLVTPLSGEHGMGVAAEAPGVAKDRKRADGTRGSPVNRSPITQSSSSVRALIVDRSSGATAIAARPEGVGAIGIDG